MSRIPVTQYDPPFAITRASHLVLTSQDLAASERFYTQVAGMVLTHKDDRHLYLRGLEEACHHSLVIAYSKAEPHCERIGLRVFQEKDLAAAKRFLDLQGLDNHWAEVPFQGLTLHFTDPVGTPIELCASMPVMPRLHHQVHLYRGGSAQRLDHFQLHTPYVQRAAEFYMTQLGFRASDIYMNEQGMGAAFLQRKGNTQDLVYLHGPGPRLHHFGYTIPDSQEILRACDTAGNLGFGDAVERGPGRHGMGHVLFVYLRDPDGHRLELHNTPYQMIDIELGTNLLEADQRQQLLPWGLPPQRKWVAEASTFAGAAIEHPSGGGYPLVLEEYLSRI
ncbi:TPA: VOC family protein [Serratia marcescens]|uniref:VOC family protein n=1 Tax=Serratia TaxID=613 RepID=UPI000C138F8F|nr:MULTISPECIES: VOC family protein [Serratia]EMB6252210.1 VOC family protein [Serratia marcescens]MBH2853452.1 VOC family protein [Serratia marcescens]MBN5271274.1 VOC family protein [Serratia marcescens]MBN5277306.1 VOC family protein [Serratia marcescens]MBN5305209.1 VOC family protein [Serratia marcescens]